MCHLFSDHTLLIHSISETPKLIVRPSLTVKPINWDKFRIYRDISMTLKIYLKIHVEIENVA